MQFVKYITLCNRRFDECEVHDDHYVLVDHDDYYMLVVYDVFVVFVTRQLICQFHKLLVTNNEMMITISSCVALHLRLPLLLHKMDTPLVRAREETTKNNTSLLLCCSSFPVPVFASTRIGL